MHQGQTQGTDTGVTGCRPLRLAVKVKDDHARGGAHHHGTGEIKRGGLPCVGHPGKTPAATTLNSSSNRASQRINGTVETRTAEMAVMPARFLFLRNIKVPLPNSPGRRPLWTSQGGEATSFAS